MSLTLRTDRVLIRAAASSRRHVLATYQAPDAPATGDRLPVNVAFVVDRSGSMDGESKFPLARLAVEQALGMLHRDDRFSLVVFDTEIDTVVPSVSATPESKRDAIRLLRGIEPRGGTDLCGGWLAGAECVRPFVSPERVSRVLLLTDGQANHGITDPERLAAIAGELRDAGVVTTTFGLGHDFDERLLDAMSHFGGGNAYYVERAPQIGEFLTSEIGEALAVVARGAALQLDPSPGMTLTVLGRYRHTRTPHGGVRVDFGDIVSGQELPVVVAVQFPNGDEGTTMALHATFTGDGTLVATESATLEWTYADHRANDRQPRDVVTDRAVAALYAARARAEATEANRDGDYRRAQRALQGTADRIAGYANGDREMHALVDALRNDLGTFAVSAMSVADIKAAYQSANASWKGRSADGRARRR